MGGEYPSGKSRNKCSLCSAGITELKTQASCFSSAKVLRECCGNSAEEFCFDGRSGLPTLCYFCYDISSFAKTIV